jgi:protocatechuate 4,5-dioxygenase beta chain
MAQIVVRFGVPHTPIFPHFVKRDGPDCEIARLFGAQKNELAATRPDLIVMFDTDHLNTFFLDALPIFAVGIDKTFKAPNDEPRDVPNYVVPSAPGLAAHIRSAAVGAGFDVGMTQNYAVDHSGDRAAALSDALNEGAGDSVLHQRPCAAAAACATLLRARPGGRPRIESWPAPKRVVVIMGSGSFSLEVGGPRMAPGRSGRRDRPGTGAARVIKLLEQQQIDALIREATEHQMLKAGNVGGEILNLDRRCWARSATASRTTSRPQMQNGHAYGVWRWN